MPMSGDSAMIAAEIPMVMRIFAAMSGIVPDPVVMQQIRDPRRHAMAVTTSSGLFCLRGTSLCTESLAKLYVVLLSSS